MARTVRTYWNNEGRLIKDHRDGRTGWVYSQRTPERLAKKAERRAAIAEAWAEATDDGAPVPGTIEATEADEAAYLAAWVAYEVHAMLDRLAA